MRQANEKAHQAQPKNPDPARPDAEKPQPIDAKPLEAKPAEEKPEQPPPFVGQVPVAQAKPEKKVEAQGDPSDLIGPALWLIGAILLLALIFWVVGRWRRRQETRDILSEQLTRFRASYDQGEMTEEEYRRVHTLLSGKMQNEVLPPPADSPPKTTKDRKDRKPSADGPGKH